MADSYTNGYQPPSSAYPRYGSQPASSPYDGVNPQSYGSQPDSSANDGGNPQTETIYESSTTVLVDTEVDPKVAAEKRAALQKAHKRHEHLAELGALATGAFALYEQHQTKVDPENAQRHRIEESVAGVASLGAAGFAIYEHHQVHTAKKEDKANKHEEKKHHGFLG